MKSGDDTNYSENRFGPPVVGVMAIFRQRDTTWGTLIPRLFQLRTNNR